MSEFYLTSKHGNLGSNVVFHRINGAGYNTDLKQAHVFTLEEAQESHSHECKALPLLKSEVDRYCNTAVDSQYLKDEHNGNVGSLCVIEIQEVYNGNDIAFICDHGEETFDFDEASRFTYSEGVSICKDNKIYTLRSSDMLSKISRRVLDCKEINVNRMIKKAGIKLNKPKRERQTTGKTRGNCPTCGKITWDLNPYHNAYCGDHEFDGYL